MPSPSSKPRATAISESPNDTHTRLHDPWLWIARAVWLTIFLFTVGLYLANLQSRYALLYSDENAIAQRWAGVRVTAPPGIANDIKGIEADFTPLTETLGPRAADIVYVGRGCDLDLPYPFEPAGKFALIDRGFCTFGEKIQNAERAGALAVIVADNRGDPLSTMTGDAPAKIPAVFISLADGDILRTAQSKGRLSAVLSAIESIPPPLEQLGIALELYANYQFIFALIVPLAYAFIALFIFIKKSDDWFALLVSLTSVVWAANVDLPLTVTVSAGFESTLGVAAALLAHFGYISVFITMCLLFPDGRFVPRWTWIVALAFTLWVLSGADFGSGPLLIPSASTPEPIPTILNWAFYTVGILALVYRYRKVATPVQRQQIKWVIFALAVGVIAAFLPGTLRQIFPALNPPSVANVLYTLIVTPLRTLGYLLVPLAIAFAILRYRLWDIDIVINRTLVYGALTAIVVGVYTFVIGTLSAVFQTSGNLFVSLIAAALVAVLFQPVHERLQQGVNRLMYGERDDPVTVLARLGQRLETTFAPGAVLPAIVETVATALKLPYAAISLKQGDEYNLAAEYPSALMSPSRGSDGAEVLSLVYQNEPVGKLIVAPRAAGETFSPADHQLLETIAHQAGTAAHAVRLTADLQSSRERLVTAREEERRRLRRDLHDGLGPRLAAQTLKIGSARTFLTRDPAAADMLLAGLETENAAALAEIRRLVYNLRPPTLDELGLVAALRESAAQFRGGNNGDPDPGRANGLHISVYAPEPLPDLPAAVEVAVYRIVQEALTNVVRHSHARACTIRVRLEDALHLEISDDGVGIAPNRHTGVGLHSMRERAEELGGTLRVEALPSGGTRISADLPVPHDGTEGA
jgi:signal transduction histidine kinase